MKHGNRRPQKKKEKQFNGSTVVCGDLPFEKAMRIFKKKIEKSGILKELRERQHYIKPTTKRKMAAAAAEKRWKKELQRAALPEKLY